MKSLFVAAAFVAMAVGVSSAYAATTVSGDPGSASVGRLAPPPKPPPPPPPKPPPRPPGW